MHHISEKMSKITPSKKASKTRYQENKANSDKSVIKSIGRSLDLFFVKRILFTLIPKQNILQRADKNASRTKVNSPVNKARLFHDQRGSAAGPLSHGQ